MFCVVIWQLPTLVVIASHFLQGQRDLPTSGGPGSPVQQHILVTHPSLNPVVVVVVDGGVSVVVVVVVGGGDAVVVVVVVVGVVVVVSFDV